MPLLKLLLSLFSRQCIMKLYRLHQLQTLAGQHMAGMGDVSYSLQRYLERYNSWFYSASLEACKEAATKGLSKAQAFACTKR